MTAAVTLGEAIEALPGGLPEAAVERERLLLSGDDELARVVRRVRRRVVAVAHYLEWLEWLVYERVVRGLAVLTASLYLDAVAEFLEHLGASVLLGDVARADLEGWLSVLYLERRQGPSTREKKAVAVRRFFAWREAQGRGPSPVADVPGPRKEHRAPRRYSKRQLRALFAACDTETDMGMRDYTVLAFVLQTGARREEVARVSMEDLEMTERTARVVFRGKGARERTVPFEGPAVRALARWLAVRDQVPGCDPRAVFVALKASPTTTVGARLNIAGVDDVLRRAVRRSGIKLSPGMALHALRATYATTLFDQGADIQRIRFLLGHQSIETTARYIAVSERQMKTRVRSEVAAYLMGEKERHLPRWIVRSMREKGLLNDD